GGENFPAALSARLQQSTHAEIINMYGPTETTVWSTTYRLPESPSRVPVGRPIANTQIYVADTNLQLVSVGITGELLIGGAGVASHGTAGEKLLLAYIIAREGKEALPRELRRHLKDKLPDYMVPAQVILMPAFPQTPNRKIDRKALPEPQPCEPQAQANHTA